jgi:hypothetical protein
MPSDRLNKVEQRQAHCDDARPTAAIGCVRTAGAHETSSELFSYLLSGNANATPRPINTLPVSHLIKSEIRGVSDNRSPIAPEKNPYMPYTKNDQCDCLHFLLVSSIKIQLRFTLIAFHHATKNLIAALWTYIASLFVSNPFFSSEFSSIRDRPQNNFLANGHGKIINMLARKIIALVTTCVTLFFGA